MKNYKILLIALAAAGITTSCANQDVDEFIVEKPETLDTYDYLNEYGNIKDYVDRAAYPNFKIACALGAADYSKRGVVYRVANANFDEITLGNAMKYASVVGDDGNMNFATVEQLLDDADKAGMSVYGHTLAWHAQQNTTYLNSCLGDISIPSERVEDYNIRYDSELFSYGFPYTVLGGFTPVIEDGILKASVKKANVKFYLAEGLSVVPGETYEVIVSVKSNKTGSVTLQFGANDNSKTKLAVTQDWNDKKLTYVAASDNAYLMVDMGRLQMDLEFAFVTIAHYTPDKRPQTAEEKTDTINRALYKWIDGMMETCQGRVKSWDLINEAISGADMDGDGKYDLQTAATGGANDFFWQDWLGHEQYGAVVSKLAREAYVRHGGNEADLKLFVNDYNLESDWDGNKKLKSMIEWIKIWEKNGAKIDGVSSQMHISYYEDKGIMASKAKHIVNMLKLMAETGKLVRISELDMGYLDINGNDVLAENMTFGQRQNQANLYRFILQMYLKIVPQAQQYSICQWCLTDSPNDSGWRAGSPVGLWDLSWSRMPAYAGYCEAFSTALPSTEDFFEFLNANGLTHYITPATEE